KSNCTAQIIMIGKSDGRKPDSLSALDQLLRVGCAIKKRKRRMTVQLCILHLQAKTVCDQKCFCQPLNHTFVWQSMDQNNKSNGRIQCAPTVQFKILVSVR